MKIALAIVIALVATVTTATAQPNALIKVGSCPSGYRESGGYCSPMSGNAPVAVPKAGQCPSGFAQSGVVCPAWSWSCCIWRAGMVITP
jgi:hypothetical protein